MTEVFNLANGFAPLIMKILFLLYEILLIFGVRHSLKPDQQTVRS